MEMDENRYKYFKGLEISAQRFTFDLPQPGSEYHNALSNIQVWEIQALLHFALRLQTAAGSAARAEYMRGKE